MVWITKAQMLYPGNQSLSYRTTIPLLKRLLWVLLFPSLHTATSLMHHLLSFGNELKKLHKMIMTWFPLQIISYKASLWRNKAYLKNYNHSGLPFWHLLCRRLYMLWFVNCTTITQNRNSRWIAQNCRELDSLRLNFYMGVPLKTTYQPLKTYCGYVPNRLSHCMIVKWPWLSVK